MAEAIAKLPVKADEKKTAAALGPWRPLDNLRREIDRLFDDFGGGLWRSPFGGSLFDVPSSWPTQSGRTMPAVDVAETDKGYEITAELPGIDEKNVEVRVADDVLTIKGEKKEEKQEKNKDYYVSERSFGSFQRSFQIPRGVDGDKIEAAFKNGVLKVTLPKGADAQKAARKINVTAA